MRGGKGAFLVVAYAFAATMVGTTLPTPLYPLYRADIGFSTLLITVIYAAYAAGVLLALLLFGQLSDTIGRRATLLPGLALSAASAVAFLVQGGLPLLFAGRVLSGLSAGLFTGTATATLLDLAGEDRRSTASLVATGVNMGGLGVGPLLSGLLSQYAGMPLRLVFIVDLALLVPAFVGVALLPTARPAHPAPFTPARLAVPSDGHGVFVRACIAGFAGFVVLGLFTAVIPSAMGELLRRTNRAAIGAVVFAVFAASTLGQLGLNRIPRLAAMPTGCAALIAGMALIAGGLLTPSLGLLLAGGIVAGLGQGVSFRTGMEAVNRAAPPDRRAAVTSAFFVVLYIAISIPVIVVGAAARLWGLRDAGVGATVAVALLAAVALVLLVSGRPRSAV